MHAQNVHNWYDLYDLGEGPYIDRRSDRPIIEKGPIDRLLEGPIDRLLKRVL